MSAEKSRDASPNTKFLFLFHKSKNVVKRLETNPTLTRYFIYIAAVFRFSKCTAGKKNILKSTVKAGCKQKVNHQYLQCCVIVGRIRIISRNMLKKIPIYALDIHYIYT